MKDGDARAREQTAADLAAEATAAFDAAKADAASSSAKQPPPPPAASSSRALPPPPNLAKATTYLEAVHLESAQARDAAEAAMGYLVRARDSVDRTADPDEVRLCILAACWQDAREQSLEAGAACARLDTKRHQLIPLLHPDVTGWDAAIMEATLAVQNNGPGRMPVLRAILADPHAHEARRILWESWRAQENAHRSHAKAVDATGICEDLFVEHAELHRYDKEGCQLD